MNMKQKIFKTVNNQGQHYMARRTVCYLETSEERKEKQRLENTWKA